MKWVVLIVLAACTVLMTTSVSDDELNDMEAMIVFIVQQSIFLSSKDSRQLIRKVFEEDVAMLRCYRMNKDKPATTLLKRMRIFLHDSGHQNSGEKQPPR